MAGVGGREVDGDQFQVFAAGVWNVGELAQDPGGFGAVDAALGQRGLHDFPVAQLHAGIQQVIRGSRRDGQRDRQGVRSSR